MLREAAAGVRLSLRNWPSMISLGLLIAATSAVLALLLSDVIIQFSVLRGGQEMRARSATFFTPYYAPANVVEVSDASFAQLSAAIGEGTAYTVVVNNIQVENLDFADGFPVIFVFGDTVAEIVPTMPICTPAPCMLLGAKVPGEVPIELRVGSLRVTGNARLPLNSAFFDANLGAVPLDHRIVVMLPSDAFAFLDRREREEAAARAVFFGNADTSVDEYIASNAKDGLFLVPHNVAVDQPARLAALLSRSAMYAIGLLAFLSIVIFAYVSLAERTLQQEQKTFQIRRAHGATPAAIAARLGGFVALVLLVIPLPILLLLHAFPDPVALAARWIIGLLLALSVALWAYFIARQRSGEVQSG